MKSQIQKETSANASDASASANRRRFTQGRVSQLAHGGGQSPASTVVSHQASDGNEIAALQQQANKSQQVENISQLSSLNDTIANDESPLSATSSLTTDSTAVNPHTDPGWDRVNKLGIVRVVSPGSVKGARLRPQPSTNTEILHQLEENTRVSVLSENKTSKWQYLLVDNKEHKGASGYVASSSIWTGMPDVNSVLHYVSDSGSGLQKLVEAHPQYKSYDIRTGDDARSIVMAVWTANEGDERTKGIYQNPEKLAEASASGFARKIFDSFDEYSRVLRLIFQSLELRAGEKIWLPGENYVHALKGMGAIPTRAEWKNTAIATGKSIGGFSAGLLEGFVGSVADIFVGLYDMVKLIVKTAVDIFMGDAISAVQQIYEIIKNISPAELFSQIKDSLVGMIASSIESFRQQWDGNNPYQKYNALGRVIGYVLAELLMLVFSGGALTAMKWLPKLGKWGAKLAKVLSKSLAKVDDVFDRIPGRKNRKKESQKDTDNNNQKARELPLALAEAGLIAESHDAANIAPSVAVAVLKARLLSRYKWIKSFTFEKKSPGKYERLMLASRHVVDDDYVVGGPLGNAEILPSIDSAKGKKEFWRITGRKKRVDYHGTYTLTFAKGKKYAGKGSLERAARSAKEKEDRYSDKLVHIDWTPAEDIDQEFFDEALRISDIGGVDSKTNYNKKNTGRKVDSVLMEFYEKYILSKD